MEYPSQLIESAVEEISKLPGIGKKTALRLALHLLKQPTNATLELSDSLKNLREKIKYCNTCHIIADTEECTCQNAYRDATVICVVEDTPDVLAIRNTGQYTGLFHVLGGRISPMDGIGPEDLAIDALIKKIQNTEVSEIILALSATVDGQSTAHVLSDHILDLDNPPQITKLAHGVPVGGELDYLDDGTITTALHSRG